MGSNTTVVGDPHLKHKNISIMSELCDQVEALGNTTVWLGDLLDTKEVIRGKCLNFWYEYFQRSRLSHIVLVGNHDWFNLECKDHSLKTLNTLSNVTVVDSLKELGLFTKCYAIPYIHDQEELRRLLATIPEDSFLFSHLDVIKFDYGNGRICDNGISLKDLSRFSRVVSGHFHKFQQDGNLTYLGTPFSHSQGEANQMKFIGVLDNTTLELSLVKTNLPRHITVEFDCDLLNENKDHMFLEVDRLGFERDYYRVFLTGRQESIDKFPKDMYLQGGVNGKLDIRFLERPSDGSLEAAEIEDSSNNVSQFNVWAREIQKLDPETVKLGITILEGLNGK